MHKDNRTVLPNFFSVGQVYPFTLKPLPYAYNALEPYIDTQTMVLHHDKHHQSYVDKLNAALEKHPALHTKSLEELLTNLPELPTDISLAIQNHGGGHYNHTFFWNCMSNPTTKTTPSTDLSNAINQAFGSFETFKQRFNDAAMACFGSGWAWLCLDQNNHLVISSSANQDSPISRGLVPLLGLDIWEHAYYLKYQNKRNDYTNAWWSTINWNFVNTQHHHATQKV